MASTGKQTITDWRGKTVWLVGASSGIGEALARLLAQEGARLILSARNEEGLIRVRDSLTGEGHCLLPLDVSDLEQVARCVDNLREQAVPLDMAFFAAGIYSPMPVTELNPTEAGKIADINLKGALYWVASIVPLLRQQGEGMLVLTASVAGYRGLPQSFAYGASKAGVIHLAETLRLELASSPVEVRLVNPGFVKSRLTDKNPFPMPFLMEADDAARAILKGLAGKSFEIHFPRRFTFGMKLLRYLPYALYFPLVRKMTGVK
jgi:short-subunit dehydrogenase